MSLILIFNYTFQRVTIWSLLQKGADGRIHSVTKYSPLYIAAYNGRRDIVDILLKKFPKLINVLTVEKWSPLHAAVINGHVSTLDLLLRFSYPKECLKTIRDKKGKKWIYNPKNVSKYRVSNIEVYLLKVENIENKFYFCEHMILFSRKHRALSLRKN